MAVIPDNIIGHVRGQQDLVYLKVDGSSSDIKAGDFLSEDTAGYVKKASAGDLAVAIAVEEVDLTGTPSDGDYSVLADIGNTAVYRREPDAGTVSQALVLRTMDIGGARSINIDASTDDCILCVAVNTDDNTLDIKLADIGQRFAGVV